MDAAPTLACRDVDKVYAGGIEALRGVDLEVAAAETLALVGESGSGKSTLIKLFNRLVEPTAGSVLVGGRPVGELDPIRLRRSMGYVQQQGGLLPHWTVERNVGLVPELLGWAPERRGTRSRELLDWVGLDPAHYGRRHPRQLSGGERQRVAFARAVAADPPVLLLDEPFAALDALTRIEVQEVFRSLRSRMGSTMVLVTHDLGEAFALADRVAVLRKGCLIQVGTPAELSAAPADPYVAALLQAGTGRLGDAP